MPPAPSAPPPSAAPLASYVLRVVGVPASLRFELHDVRTGARRVFRHPASLAEFLLHHGVAIELAPETPSTPTDRKGQP